MLTVEEAIAHLKEARQYPVAYTQEEQEAYEMAFAALESQLGGELTVDALKYHAKKLGYRVSKIQPKVKLSRCVCGRVRSMHKWCHAGGGYSYRCDECGFKGPVGVTDKIARTRWNKAVAEAKKGEDTHDTDSNMS